MSKIRIIFPSKMKGKFLLWLIVFVAALIIGGNQATCYLCKCCPDDKTEIVDGKSNRSEADVVFPDGFLENLGDSIETEYDKDNNLLRITGLHYNDEEYNGKWDNIGMARAMNAREQFLGHTDIPAHRIQIGSKLLEGTPKEGFKATEWDVTPWKSNDTRVEIEEGNNENKGVYTFYFPFNSDNLKLDPNIKIAVNELVESLEGRDYKIDLTGHTDSLGTAEVNMQMGQLRADAIKKLLLDKGLKEADITVNSKGETEPKGDNATPYGQSLNRRVELVYQAKN